MASDLDHRAHKLIVQEGHLPEQAAHILNAERPHGSDRIITADQAREMAMRHQDRLMGRDPDLRKIRHGAR